jgi:hypothetical protein
MATTVPLFVLRDGARVAKLGQFSNDRLGRLKLLAFLEVDGAPMFSTMDASLYIASDSVDTISFDVLQPKFIDAYNRLKTSNLGMTKLLVDVAAQWMLDYIDTIAKSKNSAEAIQILKESVGMGFDSPRVIEKLERYCEIEAEKRFLNRKARVIQHRFKDVVSNPYHPICKRRLMREFNSLCDETI